MDIGLPEIKLKAIGIVHNKIKNREKHDAREIISEIVLDPALTEALDNLEEFSHIIIIYYMHRSHKPAPMKVHPRYRTESTPVGVFASRSPDRPNALGKTTVRLLERRDNIIKVQGLDAIDGTPVIDIKPYIPGIDSVTDARVPPWMTKS
jgi:tRNA-Thr(GGU) m(6)t(6)A37 methyltransferase TsaA